MPARLGGAGYLSPRLKARLTELGLAAADLAAVPGTGAGGRVTVDDLEKFVADLDARATRPAPAHARGGRRRDAAQLDASAGDRRTRRAARRPPRPTASSRPTRNRAWFST